MIYRYIICVTLALLMLIMGSGCTRNPNKQNNAYERTENKQEYNMTHWTVYVNGEVINGLPVFISSTNIRLPFVQTVEVLGINVEKQSESIYVRNNSDTYVLCFSPGISFVQQGDTDNLMIAPPGTSSYYCKYELGDVFLDSDTLDGVLYRMGVDIDISVDHTSSTIAIVTK